MWKKGMILKLETLEMSPITQLIIISHILMPKNNLTLKLITWNWSGQNDLCNGYGPFLTLVYELSKEFQGFI